MSCPEPSLSQDAFWRGAFHLVQPRKGAYRSGLDGLLVASGVAADASGHALDMGAGRGPSALPRPAGRRPCASCWPKRRPRWRPVQGRALRLPKIPAWPGASPSSRRIFWRRAPCAGRGAERWQLRPCAEQPALLSAWASRLARAAAPRGAVHAGRRVSGAVAACGGGPVPPRRLLPLHCRSRLPAGAVVGDGRAFRRCRSSAGACAGGDAGDAAAGGRTPWLSRAAAGAAGAEPCRCRRRGHRAGAIVGGWSASP